MMMILMKINHNISSCNNLFYNCSFLYILSVIKYSICLPILIDETVLIYESYQVDRYAVDDDGADKIVVIM
jgi:hypothetical protein